MQEKKDFITVHQRSDGQYRVLWVWLNPAMGGFFEPYDYIGGVYEAESDAEDWAKKVAQRMGLEFKARAED